MNIPYYLQAAYKSFVSPSWLASQSKARGKAATLFTILVFFLSVGFGLHMIYRQIPTVVPYIENILREQIPDFTARTEGGILAVAQLEQPYTRTFHIEDQEVVIAVDTVSTSTVSISSFFTTTTDIAFLITRTGIVSKDVHGEEGGSVSSFDGLPNFSFSKMQLLTVPDKIEHEWRPAIFAILVAVSFALSGVGLMLFVLFFASIVYLVYISATKQPRENRYTWGDIFTMSLFSLVLPKIVFGMISLLFLIEVPYIVTLTMIFGVSRALNTTRSSLHTAELTHVDET